MTFEPLFPGLSLRQPPSNLQAEQALLGALLHNNKAIDRCGALTPEHFADPVNGHVFHAIKRRIDAGRLADAVSLKGDFENAGILDTVGGTEYLTQLLTAMVGIINTTEYAATIQDCYRRRQLIDIGEALVNQAFDGGETSSVALDAAARIDAVASGSIADSGATLGEALQGAISSLQQALERRGPAGLSTGFRSMDDRLGGLEDETLTILAARPGMGKTGLGCNIAMNAVRAGIPVIMFSLEMSRLQLARRVLAGATGVPVIAIKRGHVNVDNTGRIVGAGKAMADLPLWIEDAAGVPVSVIANRVRAWRRKNPGPAIVMLDHLHIVRPEDGDIRSGATYAVGQISGALKRLSKTCHLPVVALAQLNRGVESREDKRPGLSDLRQSGDLEQDADSIGFIYRPEYYLGHEPERGESESAAAYETRRNGWHEKKERAAGKAELIWAKVRDGEPGTDELLFDGPTTTFSEADNG